MVKLILSIIVTNILVFQNLSARTIVVKKDRTIKIDGVIYNLQKQSKSIIEWTKKNKDPIFVIINSTGGSVIDGITFMQAIDRVKARGVKVYCIVTGMAMSMATHILSACNYRYAMPTSLVMWHPMAVNASSLKLTIKTTGHLNKQMKLLSTYLDKRLKAALNISEKKYREFEEGEYIVFAYDLKTKIAPKFLSIVKDLRITK